MNEYPVASEEEIEIFFRENFVAIDNIPEDTVQRDEICMRARASILIESYCTSGRFQNFMKAGKHEASRWIYPFPKPHTTKTNSKMGYPDFHLEFEEFAVYTGSMPEKDEHGIDARWRLEINEALKTHIKFANGTMPNPLDESLFSADLKKAQADFIENRPSQFDLCKKITPYNTTDRVCLFFRNDPYVFSSLSFASQTLRPDIFHDTGITPIKNESGKTLYESTSDLESLRKEHPEWSEEASVHEVLKTIITKSKENANIQSLYEKCYANSQQMVYPFKNVYDETGMKVVKLYDFDNSTAKCFIPTTTWMRSGSIKNQLFAVPCSQRSQPLYNSNLLCKEETTVVILTDSIEIAELNQKKCSMPGVVFTSFICDPGAYGEVDFYPLAGADSVYYLITNHSGISLEAAYLKAKEISDFLEYSLKLKLRFIQLETEYPPAKHFSSLDEIVKARLDAPPEIVQASIKLMEQEEFLEMHEKAVTAINAKKEKWYAEKKSSAEEQRLVQDELDQPRPIDYILHPFLIRGEATMLFAEKSTGKSALGLSIAAAITSSSSQPKPLFKEKWWTVSKSNYKRHKVLYLDFENGQNEIESRIKKFADSYWPQNKEEHKKCRENLRIIDMGTISDNPDYSSPAYHQRIIDMIEETKDKGEKGQPVDLLVIDTYTAFVKVEYPQTPSNFAVFINKVRKMGIAILILHHANDEGKIRGQKTKLDSLYWILALYRDNHTGTDSLETPMNLKLFPGRGDLNKTLKSEFKIRFDNEVNEWQVYEPERDEKAELKLIVEFYKKNKFKMPVIAQMLGMSKSSLFDKLKDK